MTLTRDVGLYSRIVRTTPEHRPEARRSDPRDPQTHCNNELPADFATILDGMVRDRGLSNLKLEALTEYDQSFMSRLRNGTRLPSRDAVLAIVEALRLDGCDRDRLLDAAGYAPVDRAYLLRDEPAVAGLYRLLTNPETDPERRETVRNVVSALIGEVEWR